MGLPMHNLHAPTVGPVASGPLSAVLSGPQQETLSLDELNRQKETLESELTALGAVLDSHGVNMRTTLTTFDGFPRSDIDVAQIRTTRARIIHLRNDHKALMSRIELAVHARFASMVNESSASSHTTTDPSPPVGRPTRSSTTPWSNENTLVASYEPPFARINTVAAGSPAEEAGLRPGDQVLHFGEASWLNHEKLSLVAQIVGRSEGQPISVQILRNSDNSSPNLTFTLTPRYNWGGRGSLGCHLVTI